MDAASLGALTANSFILFGGAAAKPNIAKNTPAKQSRNAPITRGEKMPN
jgi:hypothetical protein